MEFFSEINEKFKRGNCSLCGCNSVSRYFSISDRFIDYNGSVFSYQQIIAESLDFFMYGNDYASMELCWDCKDNVLKFFHFKRKVKETQIIRNSHGNSQRTEGHVEGSLSQISLNLTDINQHADPQKRIGNPHIDTESTKIDEVLIKSEPVSDSEDVQFDLIESCNEAVDFADIVIKEEPEENITNYYPIPQHRLEPPAKQSTERSRGRKRKRGLPEAQLTYGAAKMRAYRERLKLPENRMKLLRQKQQQREWNRRAYIKKQLENGQPIRSRRSQSSFSDEFSSEVFQSSQYNNDYIFNQNS